MRVEGGVGQCSVFSMLEQHSTTYKLYIEDRGRDQSAFNVLEQCGGTYELIFKDGGKD
jgi:hypothetical protein